MSPRTPPPGRGAPRAHRRTPARAPARVPRGASAAWRLLSPLAPRLTRPRCETGDVVERLELHGLPPEAVAGVRVERPGDQGVELRAERLDRRRRCATPVRVAARARQ